MQIDTILCQAVRNLMYLQNRTLGVKNKRSTSLLIVFRDPFPILCYSICHNAAGITIHVCAPFHSKFTALNLINLT